MTNLEDLDEKNQYEVTEMWDYLPHISFYQIWLTFVMGFYTMVSGLQTQSVIFIFYEPEGRCITQNQSLSRLRFLLY